MFMMSHPGMYPPRDLLLHPNSKELTVDVAAGEEALLLKGKTMYDMIFVYIF
jgi:hypothetical protein